MLLEDDFGPPLIGDASPPVDLKGLGFFWAAELCIVSLGGLLSRLLGCGPLEFDLLTAVFEYEPMRLSKELMVICSF